MFLRKSILVVVFVAVVCLGLPAVAQDGYEAPFIELGLGATNMVATAGNQRLTAGVSKDGDVSVLSWPSPSYWDQLHYITTNAPDAREQPRYGAPKRAGIFAGLVLHEPGAMSPTVTYLRSWDRTVTYAQDDVRVIETTFTNSKLGLEVVQRDFVAPDRDVFIRRYSVEKTGTEQYDSIDLLGYSNLSPGLSKVPQIPLLDVLMDHKNDFIAAWNATKNAIVHFHPGDTGVVSTVQEGISATTGTLGREFGPLGKLLEAKHPQPNAINDAVAKIDENYAEGVYVALGSSPDPSDYQVGEDETDFCSKLTEIADNIKKLQKNRPEGDLPADPSVADLVRCESFDPVDSVRKQENWSYTAEDAYTDAMDGELENNRLAGGQVNTAIRVPVEFSGNSKTGEATLFFAFGKTAGEAYGELDWAHKTGAESIEMSVIDADEKFVENLWIPDEIKGGLRKFIKRAFLNLKVGTDRETGAIVASISRQPSYQLDWPRDGAFFNTALDLSGQQDLVSKRMTFYTKAMRKEEKSPLPLLNKDAPGWPQYPGKSEYPPNSWEMNYYADGTPGGNIRLEIDNTALLVWAYVAHIGHLPESKRQAYIDDVWPTVEKATKFVASWRDPETGLMWPANEDDHAEFTQGLQGAETSYLALVSAARLAKKRGEENLAEEWLHRAGELRRATLAYMGDREHGFVDYEESGPAAGRAWLAWPTHFLAYDNPRLVETTRKVLDFNLSRVKGSEGNGGYPTKVAIGAAIAMSDETTRKKSLEIADRLATEIADQNTWTIGEAIVPVDEDGDGQTDDFINGVSTPHLWSSILVYLTAVAYHHPEKFDKYRDILPDVTVPDVTPPGVAPAEGDAGRADVAPSEDAGPRGNYDAFGLELPEDDESDGCQCGAGGADRPLTSLLLFAIAVGLLSVRRRHN